MSENFDVIIIGYGPTGLVLAASLGQAGHRVAVVERWPALYGMPRLSHIDDETARIVQAVADVDVALRDSAPIPQFRFVNAKGELLTAVGAGDRVGPCGFPYDISIFQPDIEAAIDDRVASHANVERLLGWDAVELRSGADGVTLCVKPAGDKDAAARELSARYLVGCDGARSFTRGAVGISQTDFGFNERWLNVDMEILRPLPDRFGETIQVCDPARGHMHLPIGSKRLRVEVALLPGEDVAPFADAAFAWQWLHDRHGLGPDDVAIIRQLVYTFEARSADRWRAGPVLLAGDACHTMPPYMGQGACSGMRDGINLGWRLDLVLRGLASDALLDTFEVERKPHVTAITHMSIGLGKLANEHDPERAQLRDEAMRANPPQKPPFPIVLGGLLDPAGSALAGTIWPQGEVALDGRRGRFDDVVGQGFILLTRDDPAAVLEPDLRGRFEALGGHVVGLNEIEDVAGTYPRYFAEHGIAALLARPDFVLFGTVADAADTAQLVGSLLFALRPDIDAR